MPYTMAPAPPAALSALVWQGLADDDQLTRLVGAVGPVSAVRLLLPTSGPGCGGASSTPGPPLVAVDPGEVSLPDDQRQVVSSLRAGSAIADDGWSVLLGGTVALTGLDIRVTRLARLRDDVELGPVVITLSDLALSLTATRVEHAPAVSTLVVVSGARSGAAPDGWTLVHTAVGGIPVQTGLRVLTGPGVAS